MSMSEKTSHRPEPIIPPKAAPLRTLVMAMAVMCYLAVLAAGGLVLINRSVEAWTGDLAREVTVQIREVAGRNMEEDLARAAAILKAAVAPPSPSTVTRVPIIASTARAPSTSVLKEAQPLLVRTSVFTAGRGELTCLATRSLKGLVTAKPR